MEALFSTQYDTYPKTDQITGISEARLAIAEYYNQKYPNLYQDELRAALGFGGFDISVVDPSGRSLAKNVFITAGGSAAIKISLLAIAEKYPNPNKKRLSIALPPMRWHGVDQIAAEVGMDIVEVPVKSDGELDLTELDQVLAREDVCCFYRAIPGSPDGRLSSDQETVTIAELCTKHKKNYIDDLALEVLNGYPAKPFQLISQYSSNGFTVGSMSHCWAAPGIELGWLLCPLSYIATAYKQISNLGRPNRPMQTAIVAALNMPESYYEDRRKAQHERNELFASKLMEAGYKTRVPEAGMCVVVDVSGMFGKKAISGGLFRDDTLHDCEDVLVDLAMAAGILGNKCAGQSGRYVRFAVNSLEDAKAASAVLSEYARRFNENNPVVKVASGGALQTTPKAAYRSMPSQDLLPISTGLPGDNMFMLQARRSRVREL